MPDRQDEYLRKMNDILFWFCFAWTFIYIAMFFAEFLRWPIAGVRTDPTMAAVYLSLLGAYALNKELTRWARDEVLPPRPGEILPFVWLGSALLMFIINFLLKNAFVFPTELAAVCVGVVAIYFGNQASKIFRMKLKRGKGKKEGE